ncbi:ceramide glucosyltransferase [Methylorubrum sp. Q1]|uniref:ceramide glucosyltransferase n=1 Tax=Methylorubrum sp. Q1 TaxID=2562453 RepID=UPI001075E37D|nr:ceramide glucosyltransferase [Methylorubrum sp. Q1]TFZ55170.1 ceramide glucosyltransferase [Methylorubrum sp. Q1]
MIALPESGALAALALCAVLVTVNLASLAVAALRIGRKGHDRGRDKNHDESKPSAFPAGAPVSVVRPLRGLEAFSEETLLASFRLDYPVYELIFCVAEASDPILPLLERMRAAHPQIPSELILGDERIGGNPKLNNCVRGWDAARHDWVILADSNVLMPPDYIQQMQAAWRTSSGLVCSTPIGARPENFFAEVECAFLNTLQARWQYAGEALGLGFAQGKSMLWNKPFLEAQGGIRALNAEIAEDAAATKLVRAAGKRVHLVASPFQQPLGHRALSEVWSRQVRWARLRRVTFPLFFAPEIGIGALLPLVLTGLVAGSVEATLWLVGAGALWYGAEIALAARAGWHRSPRMLAALLVRDALLPAIWASAWARTAIVWRGNAMDIRTRDGNALETGPSAA